MADDERIVSAPTLRGLIEECAERPADERHVARSMHIALRELRHSSSFREEANRIIAEVSTGLTESRGEGEPLA
jgi:hypothetical protein